MSDKHADRIWTLAKQLDYCMFVTHAARGLRSRPMSTVVQQSLARIVMLSDRNSVKDDEVEANPDVLLAYSDGKQTFLSLAGRAAVSRDRELIKSVWNPGAQAFWPAGPEDPDVIAITVTPTEASFWEGDGTIVSAIKFAVAVATGSTPDLGNHGSAKL